ncbi:MAG: hypothetical protein ACI9K1_002159 [Arcticibacterium sp.]|jgi:hypothetical protein
MKAAITIRAGNPEVIKIKELVIPAIKRWMYSYSGKGIRFKQI